MEQILAASLYFVGVPVVLGLIKHFRDRKVKKTQENIRFIDFEDFRHLRGLPRSPDNDNITISLDSINRNESLLIFISHCWMRGVSGTDGWNNVPHPDTLDNDKFKLCVEGIDWVKQYLAPGMKKCYVWLDYGCIDQDNRSNLPKALKCYDKIIQSCDAIFTPISDNPTEWDFAPRLYNMLIDYKAKLWNGNTPQAYLNRAWCRVEMLYAANIPVLGNSDGVERSALFAAGLAHHIRMNRRPHLLFGHKEVQRNTGPLVLPPLLNTYFDAFNPLQGQLSVPSDTVNIERLIEDLQPYIDANRAMVGYTGDINDEGQRHGQGIFRSSDGNVYEGEWRKDRRHGRGSMQYCEGEVYEGDWVDGKKHGRGRLTYSDGAVYEGDFKQDVKEGQGTYRYANGDVYVGSIANDYPEGRGVIYNTAGDVYEGEFKNGYQHGRAVSRFVDGEVFVGVYEMDQRHGPGRSHYASGRVYDQMWERDQLISNKRRLVTSS